jgi:hypothetical protein
VLAASSECSLRQLTANFDIYDVYQEANRRELVQAPDI